MRSTIIIGSFASALAMAAPAAASDKFWQSFADIGAVGIPAAAGVITLTKDDRQGLKQLAFSGGTALATTEILKYAINSERPNGGDHSFPSLHTSMAFTGAAYLHARYGWQTALPFELLAVGVGYARVKSHDHHWYDVVGGAAIGTGSALIFTRRFNDDVRVSAGGDSTGGMITVAARF